ncbi:MAG: aminotransferase class I/II-fold pyridoxal phosphate-dependent enzyme [Gordonia sp. (in: high G+C Gram-positive bacteria)]
MTPTGVVGAGTSSTVRCDLNESAYPPLPAVTAALREVAPTAHRYPEFRPTTLRREIAAHLGAPERCVTLGPGATAVIHAILAEGARHARAAGIAAPRVVTPAPTFDGFPVIADLLGLVLTPTPLHADGRPDLGALAARIGPDTIAAIVCSPHNPTGAVISADELDAFLARVRPGVRVILDQAYVEFCPDPPDIAGLLARHPELVIVRSFSKAYGLAGLRLGYALGRASAIDGIRRHELPFAIGAAAALAAPIALRAQDELLRRVRAMRVERARLAAFLSAIGVETLPSEANFLYAPGPAGLELGAVLRGVGIHGKTCGDHGFRLTVADAATTDHLMAALRFAAACV